MYKKQIDVGLKKMETRYTGPVIPSVALITPAGQALIKRQRPMVIWMTGLSGAGKSTLARMLGKELHRVGHHAALLDGDNLRLGLNNDLDFSDASRHESVRRVAEVARLMVYTGLIVIVSFISPFRADREAARALFSRERFFEVHVDAPLHVVQARVPQGLYRKAREGLLGNFTGIDSPYEAPLNPELRLNTSATTPEDALG
ncbi:adenylyl-sulfate kinase [Paraburkholderia atlantica]|uniref:adenylyl-sulfate kinase n=1 Tax=Paraburkholderia atlantica TaxID=2654982 RepID=UPI003D21BC82